MGNAIDFNSPEAKVILDNLHAFSWDLFGRLFQAEVNERGKSFQDYVQDAIEKHINEEDNYDPSRGPLDYHLKYHVIKQAMFNDLPPQAKKKYKAQAEPLEESYLTGLSVRKKLPSFEGPPLADVVGYDSNLILLEIQRNATGDEIVELIYLAVCEDSFELSDRSEICAEYGISLGDFDNGRRRFKTVVENVLERLKVDKRDYL